ncbi:hypothetical protein F53441_3518 [Fusarium austroafricanum]|uniref:Uncharacterized protein n=1 Tax=Fusarium austroafricanum TaxID=2364996 RepID=A0A8H4KME9_9HYPO|nr:hypothetical protein F53441_3518 [Fusarium austroafricanum]
MSEYVEFYVSCNPPLLPNGVSSVIEDLKNEFGQNELIEILYEPEIPWFKLITDISNQPKISTSLHHRLERLLHSETDDIDKHLGEIDLEEFSAQPDVKVVAESPHIISFPSYQTISEDLLKQYDLFRYPDHIKDLPYKTLWRVPEASWVSIFQLVLRYKALWPASLSEPSIDTLGKLVNCEIARNMQWSVVYIGSSEGEQALRAMTRKLDVLAAFMDAPSASTIHMVFTETPGSINLCYQWLTHTGLSKLTYVDSPGSQQNREYGPIAGAASLRIEEVNIHGKRVPDRTSYPIEPKNPATWQPHFDPFAGYSYKNKRSGTTAVNHNKRPLQCPRSQPLDKNSNITEPGGKLVSHRGTRESLIGDDGLYSEGPLFSLSARLPDIDMPCDMGPSKNFISSFGLSGVGNDPEDSKPLYQNSLSMTRWIGGVISGGGVENRELCSPQLEEPKLIDFEDSTPETADKQAGRIDPSIPQTVRSPGENLMDLLDSSINTPALLDEVFMPARVHEPEALLNVQEAGSEVLFNRKDDKPKTLFETVRQKAAPGPSWANVASSKPDKQKDDLNFGENVRVTLAPGKRHKTQYSKDIAKQSVHTVQEASEVTTGTGYFQAPQRGMHPPAMNNSSQGIEHAPAAQIPRTVPRMDMPTMGLVDNDEIVAQAEVKLRELMEIVQVAPGNISVQAEFGRLCFKDMFPGSVHNGARPSWPIDQVVNTLNTKDQDVGFYPILTTSGAEASLIPRAFGGRASWLLMEKRVYYEFLCMAQETAPVVIEVDADTFRHEYFPLAAEVSRAFVHCTERAWDIKFSISRKDTGQIDENFGEFATSLVRDMSVETNETGEVVINVEPESASEWCIDRVRIRHEAKYRNGAKGPSCLKITMTRIVQGVPGIPKERYRGQSVPVAAPKGGQPSQWFEASISSIRAEGELQENISLEFGEKTHWTPENLESQGVFNAICEPALRMVSHMDQVGNSNDNSHDPRTDGQPSDSAGDAKAQNQKKTYW